MKVKRYEIERAVKVSPAEVRLFLLHGPDVAGSAELADAATRSAGGEVEKVAINAASLKGDPALLADEAASFSLFGGKRVIVVDGGGDEMLDAVEGLLDAPVAGNLVVIVAGLLRKGSKLLAAVEASTHAMACASYVPEGRDADRMVIDLGRQLGLSIASPIARRIAAATAGDRALVAHELAKFMLFLDAAPERPVTLDDSVVDALSSGAEEGDVLRLVDTIFDGDPAALEREYSQLPVGSEVPLVRALSRRVLLLAKYRAEVERGSSASSVMASAAKSLFYKDRVAVERQLSRWNASHLAWAFSQLLTAERALKSPGSIGIHAITEPMYTLARAAMRLR